MTDTKLSRFRWIPGQVANAVKPVLPLPAIPVQGTVVRADPHALCRSRQGGNLPGGQGLDGKACGTGRGVADVQLIEAILRADP